ncbi:MAG: TCR/Tet family MFS transporter [Bacteroidetes bacterium]|nr:TCR/Tet family MFS transporter [Bacteroidota bacterium]
MIRNTRKAALGFIFITILIDVIGFGIIIPVIPKLITELTGESISKASVYGGWLLFTYSIFQFLCSPIIGNLSDHYGRRPVLLFSLFGVGIDYIALVFAPSIFWLFIARAFAGIAGASISTAGAYIADISTPEKRAQNFGIIGVAFGLGFIIGPVIGGVLGHYGSRLPFIAAATLTFLNLLYGYFILPESLANENKRKFDIKRANPFGAIKQIKKYPLLLGLLSAFMLLNIAHHSVQSNWTYFTMERFKWNEALVGYSLGVVGILVAIVQGGLTRVINPKIGQLKSVYLGLILYILGFILFAFANQSWMMFAFLIPYCLGGISMPAMQSIMANKVPKNAQGELQGIFASATSATSIIGPPLMTGVFAFFTKNTTAFYFPGAAFVLGAVFTIIALMLVIRTFKLHYSKAN